MPELLTQISHCFYAIRSCLGIWNAKSILISQVILYMSCLKISLIKLGFRLFLVFYILSSSIADCVGEWILHYLMSAKFRYQRDGFYTQF